MTRIFSGIQPTGTKHIGNLLGAIRHWVAAQDEADCTYCIVDMHSITVPVDPVELRTTSLELAMLLVAAGIDEEKSVLFVQSQAPEHAELQWILNCVTSMGELRRMTQFKEKSEGQELASVGLFDYPVLQAADVLVHDADRVPVGEDQRQHLELMRDLAQRFNHRYGETFVVPEASIPPHGARIVDLQEPQKKMSTTRGHEQGTLYLLDPPAALRKKVMSAVTDSGSEVRHDPEGKPGVSGLLDILSAVSDTPVPELEERFAGQGYGAFKREVAEAVIAYLEPIQQRYAELSADPAEFHRRLARGAECARERASKTVLRAKAAVGFLPASPS
jgi:tryptophanyl-tRNA synthetase